MKVLESSLDGVRFLTDAELAVSPQRWWFEPLQLQQRGLLRGVAQGRGSAWFVSLHDSACVLRHYFRGGLVGRLTRDRFVWNGLERSRAWREWHLLAQMHAAGLPVPRPFAAAVERRGWMYRCDIITQQLPATQTLADVLANGILAARQWHEIGRVIAEFHRHGIWHADLNARNILLDQAGRVFVIDFDKAKRRRIGVRWQQANLQRLLRSLHKFAVAQTGFHFTVADWSALLQGYEQG